MVVSGKWGHAMKYAQTFLTMLDYRNSENMVT